jgi:hypothetical protein
MKRFSNEERIDDDATRALVRQIQEAAEADEAERRARHARKPLDFSKRGEVA